MREIVEWLCPVCGSDELYDRGNTWHCTNCDSIIPADVVSVINRMRREVKKRIARKTYRKSKKMNK